MAVCLRFCLWITAAAAVLRMQAVVAQQCTENFKDTVSSDGSRRGQRTTIETRLIPSMRFTCSGTIVAYTVTGRNRNGAQDPKVQVWRENKAQCGYYRKLVSEIVVNATACSNLTQLESEMPAQIFHCALKQATQVSVQFGDILGLELPPTTDDDFELYFTDGGPVNYVFQQLLSSTVDVTTKSSKVEEQPQITLDVISDLQCSNGYPTVTSEGSSKGAGFNIVTRLIPDLKFTCDGIITQFTVGGAPRSGVQDPKIQVWRENPDECGTYIKPVTDIAMNGSVCNGTIKQLSSRVFQCTLKETFRIQVQPGDILGLELPPTSDDDFEMFFTSGGPTNYVFQNQISSEAVLSSRASEVQEQPQINITVEALATSEVTTTTGFPNSTTNSGVDVVPSAASNGIVPAAVGGAIAGVVILVILITMTIVITITWKRNKKWTIAVSNGVARTNEYPLTNPIYTENAITSVTNNNEDYDTPIDGTFDYEDIDEKELSLEADSKPKAAFKTTPAVPPTNGNFYSKTPKPPALDDNQNYETPVPTLPRDTCEGQSTPKQNEPVEDDTYWEPASDVNELYQQLSANKYRDIKSSQIQITKTLGSGQFGTVNRGIWQSPMGAMDVAVKQLQSGASEEDKVKFLQEAAINGQFRHPNVVKLMGVVTGKGPTMIVLELLSNGDLLNFLLNQRPSPSEAVPFGTQQMLLRFCQHVASGMSYLASKSFIHRDLAARNILVSEDRICKISDFGMSRDVEDENYYVSKGGKVPVKWTAPEALHYKKYSTASDVWSFGCVMYEIWSLGHKPFEIFTNAETLRRVEKGYRLPPPPGLTKELYKTMLQCWKPESSRRPTFPQLVEMLSRADFELFAWEEEDLMNIDPQVKVIGAPLEVAQNLFPELQSSYAE